VCHANHTRSWAVYQSSVASLKFLSHRVRRGPRWSRSSKTVKNMSRESLGHFELLVLPELFGDLISSLTVDWGALHSVRTTAER
jgi:hypothetical protein